MKGFSDVRIVLEEHPFNHFQDAVPVAVELLPNAQNLLSFEHPDNAVYVFGPEDGNVAKSVRGLCHHRVFIPTRHCTNLGAAIYLILYDRLAKQFQHGAAHLLPLGQVLAEPRGWPVNDPVFDHR